LVFTYFYPFVSESPCLAWGLPARFARFEQLLARASVVSGNHPAYVLSAHQGEWERDLALRGYRGLGLEPQGNVLEPAEFEGLWPSSYPVFLFFSPLPNGGTGPSDCD
jgi:hypothetical protein